MPLYDYRCESCGDFRASRPMAQSNAAQPCPACGARSERMLSAPFLAGSGDPAFRFAQRPSGSQRVSWRSACGFGCTHANCARSGAAAY